MDVRPRLPPELIEAILPHLVPLPSTPLWMLQLEDLTTLRACCLVSSQWRAYAQPQLWSRVILSTTEKLTQFVQVLRASDLQFLQRAVKELWIIAEHERGVNNLFGDYIALRMFPGLRALRVEGLHIPHDFLSFGRVPPLASLSVSRLAVYHPEDMRLLNPSLDNRLADSCNPVPERHLELRNVFGCSARGSLDKIIHGRNHLESLSIVEALDMQRMEYLWCMQTLTSTPQRSSSSSQTEDSSRQSGLKKLSLTFSPGWGASGRPYDVNLSQQMNAWTILLPQCPPTLTDLTLSLFTAVPWVQLLIHVLPPSITFLTLLLDREAENPNRTEQGYQDTGLQVSRMVLHELKDDKMPNLRRMLWRDRSGACLGFLVGARLREELAQRGIELIRDA
ncbi:hypothetical protein MVLG_05188 [Microbotryum lychnidis-dioicae p1A1 Lamole]|uniref:Uncharacterized protein n=1 Tax=Microbotryum lychnidis-dioicae (strain p1A1 Lamole / MvSl-1064) TaxID=683840 RepID=U5HDH5_USTV1|nr:hypothetical protein MVLG_05188 [Microbotryum lychnidis-dioicae p1A1 Lamole]|eukprot:KDE04398.1 hypothetical protein MVLG_05188 [Microbotryum lychnidis-dioicae p1A1 Lamole]